MIHSIRIREPDVEGSASHMMEGKTIGNAGLVLTAPFLPHFFRNLGYLDVMRFADEKTHAKAIYLLEYMATGNESTTGELSLNALLCGWPINRSLPPSPPLSDVEKQQANQVVDAIRAHWIALGDMTSDDLRQQFFRRQASLDIGFDSLLRVEKEPQDSLLRELPWVYALTKTPWSETITVEWNN